MTQTPKGAPDPIRRVIDGLHANQTASQGGAAGPIFRAFSARRLGLPVPRPRKLSLGFLSRDAIDGRIGDQRDVALLVNVSADVAAGTKPLDTRDRLALTIARMDDEGSEGYSAQEPGQFFLHVAGGSAVILPARRDSSSRFPFMGLLWGGLFWATVFVVSS